MKKAVINIVLIGILLSVFSCNSKKNELPYYNTPDFTPQWLDKSEANERITHVIDSFNFTDQDAASFSSEKLKGKFHVSNFFFTSCPGICPKMTNYLGLVQNKFINEDQLVLLSYTVTPWADSVSRLKQYAEQYEVKNKRWHLLTGNKSDIYSLARKSYFAEEEPGFDKDSTNFLHTEHMLLVDKTGRLRGIYNGTLQLEAERLIEDIGLLLKE